MSEGFFVGIREVPLNGMNDIYIFYFSEIEGSTSYYQLFLSSFVFIFE